MAGPTYEQRLVWIENCINKLLEEVQKLTDLNTASRAINESDDTIESMHSDLFALESVVQRLKSKVEKIEKERDEG